MYNPASASPFLLRRACLLALAVVAPSWLTGCTWREQERTPTPFTSEDWDFGRSEGRKLATEHYEIYTTLSDDVLIDALPDFVETAYASYSRWAPPAREPEKRMRVYLFAQRGEWEAFTRRLTGRRAEQFLKVRYGGYSEGGVSVIEYVSHAVTFPLFAHEGLHQYLHTCVQPGIPAWLNEGLAVACEGQRWNRDGIDEFDPWYNPMRRNHLAEAYQRNQLYPLEEILRTHAGEVIVEATSAVRTYYAQVWALVMFLQSGQDGKYAADFRRLLDTLHDPQLAQHARAAHIWSDDSEFSFGEALFRSFITEDLEEFEREFRAYVRDEFLTM